MTNILDNEQYYSLNSAYLNDEQLEKAFDSYQKMALQCEVAVHWPGGECRLPDEILRISETLVIGCRGVQLRLWGIRPEQVRPGAPAGGSFFFRFSSDSIPLPSRAQ